MRPARAPLHSNRARGMPGGLRAVASAAFVPKGPFYDPRGLLRRPYRALRGGRDAIVVAFRMKDRHVRVTVFAAAEVSSEDVDAAIEAARGEAAVDDDPTEFLSLVRGHPVLGPLARANAPRLGRTPTIFESLAVAIIEQLVTGFEARAAIRRLWRFAGAPVDGTDLVAAPLARDVHRVAMWKLREIGIGARRALTLHQAAGRGDAIERLRAHPPDVVVEKLQSLPGIGPWTSHAVARNALGWSDAVPIGDFHAPFTISASLAGRDDLTRDDAAEANHVMLEALEPFRPHRARVALLLESAQMVNYRLPRIDPHRREPWKY